MLLAQALEDQGEDMEAASAAAVASAAASEDLHASLETQLRSSQADIGRLQSELKRVKAAAEAASPVTDETASASARDGSSLEAHQQLQDKLDVAQAQCRSLRAEVAQLKEAAAAAAESPVSRDGSQTASVSCRATGPRASLPNGAIAGTQVSLAQT